mgnify:CR=1 FL=1
MVVVLAIDPRLVHVTLPQLLVLKRWFIALNLISLVLAIVTVSVNLSIPKKRRFPARLTRHVPAGRTLWRC